MKEKQKSSETKRIIIISLIVTIIVNFIVSDPIVYTYKELIRFFSNGFQSQVFVYFLENLGVWLLMSFAAFFGTFALLKAISIQVKKDEEEYIKKKNESDRISENYEPTKRIAHYVSFDDRRKKWALYDKYGLIDKVFEYKDVVDFELLEDGKSVASGGLGRALVGGALFGGVGAIVGGITGRKKTKEFCHSLKLKITINDINNPTAYITFINEKTRKDSEKFKNISEVAQDCLSTFQIICNNQDGKLSEQSK